MLKMLKNPKIIGAFVLGGLFVGFGVFAKIKNKVVPTKQGAL